MVAAPFGIQSRCASHFAANDQQDAFAEAACFDIFDEGGHGVIQRLPAVAHSFFARRIVFIGVHVPNEIGRHGHKAAAGFTQARASSISLPSEAP